MLRAVRISILPLALVAMAVHASAALRIDVLRPVAALPPHLVGLFEEPLGFQQPASGGASGPGFPRWWRSRRQG